MTTRTILLLLFAVSYLPAQASEQPAAMPADEHACHMGGSVGYIPGDVLQLPITLRDNVGHVNDPVTTKSSEAQAFYNQGIAYLHSYVWIDAARSFNQALRLGRKRYENQGLPFWDLPLDALLDRKDRDSAESSFELVM